MEALPIGWCRRISVGVRKALPGMGLTRLQRSLQVQMRLGAETVCAFCGSRLLDRPGENVQSTAQNGRAKKKRKQRRWGTRTCSTRLLATHVKSEQMSRRVQFQATCWLGVDDQPRRAKSFASLTNKAAAVGYRHTAPSLLLLDSFAPCLIMLPMSSLGTVCTGTGPTCSNSPLACPSQPTPSSRIPWPDDGR